MTPWVADHRHLALVGIPASAMVADARRLAAVYQPGTFELPGHGFEGAASLTGSPEPVRFGGDSINGVALDSNIDPRAYYLVGITNNSPDFFTVTNAAGVPLVLAGDGVDLPFVIEDIRPKLDLIMAQWTSKVIAAAKAYKAPWYVPPAWAPLLIAQLASPTVAAILRVARARFDVDSIIANQVEASKQYDDLLRGVPFDDGTGPIDADTIPNDAARATNGLLTGCVAPMPWLTGTL